jgi:hypothetical protein
MKQYDFAERLAYSEGVDCPEGLRDHLLRSIPGAYDIQRANLQQDLNGTDFWLHRYESEPLSIDFKHRSFCPIERWNRDDLCIETCSVYKGNAQPPYEASKRIKIGWTLDTSKQTDLLIYTWPAGEKRRRFYILFFPHLCEASRRHREGWVYWYREKPTDNGTYFTLNVYVPRKIVAKAMRELVEGVA